MPHFSEWGLLVGRDCLHPSHALSPVADEPGDARPVIQQQPGLAVPLNVLLPAIGQQLVAGAGEGGREEGGCEEGAARFVVSSLSQSFVRLLSDT